MLLNYLLFLFIHSLCSLDIIPNSPPRWFVYTLAGSQTLSGSLFISSYHLSSLHHFSVYYSSWYHNKDQYTLPLLSGRARIYFLSSWHLLSPHSKWHKQQWTQRQLKPHSAPIHQSTLWWPCSVCLHGRNMARTSSIKALHYPEAINEGEQACCSFQSTSRSDAVRVAS